MRDTLRKGVLRRKRLFTRGTGHHAAISEFRRLWPAFQQNRGKNTGFVRIGEAHVHDRDGYPSYAPVFVYPFKGYVEVGCHSFDYAELDRIAGLLGLKGD